MSSSSKRVRESHHETADIATLDAREVITFQFDSSPQLCHPEFVHQNFGEHGKILWPKELLPLSIKVHVNTYDNLRCKVLIEHGGSDLSELASASRQKLLNLISRPCDLGGGCKPALYPGDISGQSSSVPEPLEVEPSIAEELSGGFVVHRYQSKLFQNRVFQTWRRAEWLMLWFIESVSQSEHESDPNWEYVLLRNKDNSIVALCSLYRFPSFSFLDKGFIGDRMRLSQFLTIPSGWNAGYGSSLLKALAQTILSRNDVDKFTMEDPSFGMTSVRESVYLKLSHELGLLGKDPSIEDLEETLKIPRIFAKHLKNLIEISKLLQKLAPGNDPVGELLQTNSEYVQRFLDSIEFYDDNEDDSNETGVMTSTKTETLIRERLGEAVLKLKRIIA